MSECSSICNFPVQCVKNFDAMSTNKKASVLAWGIGSGLAVTGAFVVIGVLTGSRGLIPVGIFLGAVTGTGVGLYLTRNKPTLLSRGAEALGLGEEYEDARRGAEKGVNKMREGSEKTRRSSRGICCCDCGSDEEEVVRHPQTDAWREKLRQKYGIGKESN